MREEEHLLPGTNGVEGVVVGPMPLNTPFHHHAGGAEFDEPSEELHTDQQESDPSHTNNLDLMDFGRTRRSRMSFVAPPETAGPSDRTSLRTRAPQYGALLLNDYFEEESEGVEDEYDEKKRDEMHQSFARYQTQKTDKIRPHPCPAHGPIKRLGKGFAEVVEQSPAIIATNLLILMVAVPFGVAYFPIGWTNDVDSSSGCEGGDGEDDIAGSFPLPGKESLGIRMALFATLMGQIVMTFASNFANPVSFQLLENVPFYHSLAHIVIQEQGYGMDALATLFFLFGLSSVMVGLVFFTLGHLKLGRVAYFFPAHVLVGCIGGIGAFIIVTAIEVTNNQDFSFDMDGIISLVENFHLFGLVVLFEVTLRVLSAVLVDQNGNPSFRFLAPIFFCSIVPVFYLGLFILGISSNQAREWGYLFPDPSCPIPNAECKSVSFHDKVYNGHVLDVFKVIDFRVISWTAVAKSTGTLLALCSFSLIHVPINIPAFAVSSNVDVDMNNELVAHGYSNMLSGLFGGLQNVMTYSFSVLFQKSGGGGIPACLSICAGTVFLFVYGPAIAVYFPRCMAGTLLLHIGLDLFLEGVYDSFRNFDALEYFGIWLITISMQVFGMSAALVAGILSALSTYAVQSIQHLDPIFRVMRATTLRSSAWGRPSEAMVILDNAENGRSRILILQLQGHIFFGNIADLTDTIKEILAKTKSTDEHPIIVVLDFTLVVGMDSSAAHGITKLKGLMHQLYDVEVSIFVTGGHREGFPCEYALSAALCETEPVMNDKSVDFNDVPASSPDPSRARRGSVNISAGSKSMKAVQAVREFPKNRVCTSLDEALVFAEDILIARENSFLLTQSPQAHLYDDVDDGDMTEQEERAQATSFLENIVPMEMTPQLKKTIASFVAKCTRKEYNESQILWREGDFSNCANILLRGTVCATLDGTKVREIVNKGNLFGELGLVDSSNRLSTVTAVTNVVVYSMDKKTFDSLVHNNQREARLLERTAIRYLAHRVQHVSNRIYETHCLPI